MSTKHFSLRLLTLSGLALLIAGVTLFFNSLGRGGGFLATSFAVIGAISLLIALVWFITAAARRRIADAQRARWAKWKSADKKK